VAESERLLILIGFLMVGPVAMVMMMSRSSITLAVKRGI
jgi:hypothetical protein